MPRQYRMSARQQAKDETRLRIVEAARALQSRDGIVTTSYDAIAAAAGVATPTVYRHFPTLEALIPACAADIAVLQPVTEEYAATLFAGLETPWQRIDLLVEGTCDCYERDRAWLHAARREDGLHRSLTELAELAVANLALLVRVALRGVRVSRDTERTLVALIDYPFWHSLQAAGFGASKARRRVLELVRQQVGDLEGSK
jgi:AcrR family transcriptional regulator